MGDNSPQNNRFPGTSPSPPQEERAGQRRSLLKMMVFATGLSFGGMGAFMASMKDFFAGDAALQFSFRTVIGFVLGFLAGWLFWRFVLYRIARAGKTP
jgi:hypothetical protein